jgi:hypothetical protein
MILFMIAHCVGQVQLGLLDRRKNKSQFRGIKMKNWITIAILFGFLLTSGCCSHPHYKTYVTWHKPNFWEIESRCLACDVLVGSAEIDSGEYLKSQVVKNIYLNQDCHLVK